MKKNLKKALALLLATILVLSLCLTGCSNEKDIAGTISSSDTPANEPEEETLDEGAPLSLGRMQGGVYTNSYMGIQCELDENWTFYSAEELQTLPDDINELLGDTEMGEVLDGITQITDMKAENTNDLTTMNILYQEMGLQERLLYSTMSYQDVVDSTLEQSEMIIDSYAAAGMENAVITPVTVEFLGEERPALKTQCETQGVPYYVLQVFDYSIGKYSVTLTVGSFMEDKTEQVLALFTPYSE